MAKRTKPNIHLSDIITAVMLCFGMWACDKMGPDHTDAESTTIRLHTGSTRAESGNAFEIQENSIGCLRLLIYESRTEEVFSNTFYPSLPGDITIEDIPVGTYQFVFIANETSNVEGLTYLNGIQSKAKLPSGFRDFSFSSQSFNNEDNLPMAAIYKLKIKGDNALDIIESDSEIKKVDDSWQVSLQRLAIKVNLTLSVQDGPSKEKFTALRVVNVPDRIYLFPKKADGAINDNTGSVEDDTAVTQYRTFAKGAGDSYDPDGEDGHKIVPSDTGDTDWTAASDGSFRWYKRLILPAVEFASTGELAIDKAKAIRLEAVFVDGTSKKGLLGPVTSGQAEGYAGYAAPRNYTYELTGILPDDGPEEIRWNEVTVQTWYSNNIEVNN